MHCILISGLSNLSGKLTSARVNFGTRISTQELRHRILTSAQVINFDTLLFHGTEVNISIEHGAEVTRAEHRLPRNY